MSKLTPYLVFPGSCRQAISFYAAVFGGSITKMETFGESPIPTPEKDQDRIYNAELCSDLFRLKCSDDLPSHPVLSGTNISLFLQFEDEKDKLKAFWALSEKGRVLFPVDDNFGMVRDKFGIQWMFVHET